LVHMWYLLPLIHSQDYLQMLVSPILLADVPRSFYELDIINMIIVDPFVSIHLSA